MTLEQLVTDLSTSQRLKDAGFSQDTVFSWAEIEGGYYCDESGDPQQEIPPYADVVLMNSNYHGVFLCAAPTAGELEEWLYVRGFSLETWYGTDSLYHIEQRGYVFRGNKPLAMKNAMHVAALAALVLEVAG